MTGACAHATWAPLYDEVEDYEHRSAAPVAFVRCTACGLIRQDPAPSAETLREGYPADYRAHVSSDDAPSLLGRAVASLKSVQAELLVRDLRSFLPAENEAILEIGCGAGHLLKRLRAHGWARLAGVDRNPDLRASIERAGVAFTACDVEDAHWAERIEGRFHTIILQNVIEHLAEPERVLAECTQLLEPDGELLLVTPNTASFSHRVFGRFWSGLHAPRHVLLHRPSTLRASAKALGFEEMAIAFPTDPASWALSAQNLVEDARGKGRAPRYGTRPYALGLLPLFFPLAMAESALGRGSSMVVRLSRPHAT